MTKYGETNGYSASDFFYKIENYLGKGSLDYMIINNHKPSAEILDRYKNEKAEFVIDDTNILKDVKVIKADLLNESNILRHDPKKIKKVIDGII